MAIIPPNHNEPWWVEAMEAEVDSASTPTREVVVEFDEASSRTVRNRAVERPRGYWKLRNGKFIAMSEMDDEHLNNCIRLCERNSQARGRRADPNAPGVYGELVHESNRRNIRIREHVNAFIQPDRLATDNQSMEAWLTGHYRLVDQIAQQQQVETPPAPHPEIGLPPGAPKRRIKT